METLRLDATDDSPLVIMDKENKIFELSGKSLPEDVSDFYQPVLDWLEEYRLAPNPDTNLNIKLVYFNTASSKMILDILMIIEEIVEEGYQAVVKWYSLNSDEDMQEAGKEYEEMVDVPFEHLTYEL